MVLAEPMFREAGSKHVRDASIPETGDLSLFFQKLKQVFGVRRGGALAEGFRTRMRSRDGRPERMIRKASGSTGFKTASLAGPKAGS